ncbi:conserved hypothetical protein [Candidatus Nitrotoga sp. HW29]|uniref:hypothetical protein n=1 Tax=Candidatus Nitrotoga sp. HW29 TaxID=2886963 RepID=UPI001EF39910|nr:hypothetical protein [Candidatus Nitrotoga sp. HW29]CAH1905934.1 conserved hypothetical protein [Candidatus Nitrotoga sp. HW29]
MLKVVFGITAITLGFAVSSYADTPRIDNREAKQEQRIDQGIRSGALTPKEEAKLDAGQVKVERMEERAKADGTVTQHERKRINRVQNEQSQKIHDMKHNGAHTH